LSDYKNSTNKHKSENHFVIIGDIIRSREFTDRYELQKSFLMTLNDVQAVYTTGLTSPLTITIGDEFQAVMQNADDLYDMLFDIENRLYPATLRYGFGIGLIHTELNRERSIGMDGPAFYYAREAVENARKSDKRYELRSTDETLGKRVNLLLDWLDVSTRRWSREKKSILHYHNKNKSQVEIASLVKLTQPAVSQHIKDPFMKLVLRTQQQIQSEIGVLLESR
jgi:hypothetical protein